MTAEDYLRATGHNSDGCCEKCWSEAATLYACGQGAYESHTAAYFAVLERHGTAAQVKSGQSGKA
jgi:hypothetical protein